MAKTPKEIADDEAAAKAAADKLASEKAAESANGFPADTPLDQMTVGEREAYWKHQARKHESTVKARADYDQLKADSDELAKVKAANASEQEKAVEEARRQGENLGAQRYLKDAVMGRFQGITGKTDEEVETIFEHVDALSFTNEKGDIDSDALKKYADTFGTKEQQQEPRNPIRDALDRQRQGGGGGSSLSDLRKSTRDSMTKKPA